MVEKSAEEVPMENLTISARDYNDLVLMLEECKIRMQRVAMDGSVAGEWCKNIGYHLGELKKKYK